MRKNRENLSKCFRLEKPGKIGKRPAPPG